MEKIKILIVDDHPLMRDALQMSIAGEDDMQVVGEAANGVEALNLLKTLAPDVILMDLLMPKMDGFETITQIFESDPQAKILVTSSMEDEERVLAAIQAGALGYFPKSAPRQYLFEAIRKVADGIPYMPAGITLKLFQGLRHVKTAANDDLPINPTARQYEILVLMAEGRSDAMIAKKLHLEEATVRSHIHQILQRLGLDSRLQAVAYVNQHLK